MGGGEIALNEAPSRTSAWASTPLGLEIKEALARNWQLPETWRMLVLLTRKTADERMQQVVEAMTARGFRQAVFSFFLPQGARCKAPPSSKAFIEGDAEALQSWGSQVQ